MSSTSRRSRSSTVRTSSWNQPTDNVDAPSGIDYEIFINGNLATTVRGTGWAAAALLSRPGSHTVTVGAADSSGSASGVGNSATVTVDPFCER
jgi:hypothetical protein